MKKQHGNTGNKHAAKSDEEKLTDTLTIRCKKPDHESWKKAAAAEGIDKSKWIINKLNKCIDNTK